MTKKTAHTTTKLMPLACAAALAFALSGPVSAEDADTTTVAPSGQTFEIHDGEDSPPVNYRSEQDERYDTPEQRDAEMFAEQFEKERAEKAAKDRALLDGMNTLTTPGGSIGGGGSFGANDAGFPARAPY
ncbi:MAG: hypothetical protein Q7S99_01090 [Parvibaculum sp.]|nr:hypothetical protein [Parvibaculum sp.]|tara:strand:- start:12068 stop:12457 length:390 start_codon:yes stop_codon:yes gene_type:complete